MSWSLPEELTEARIEQLLFSPAPAMPAAERPLPNWAEVHFELRRKKNVTLALLSRIICYHTRRNHQAYLAHRKKRLAAMARVM